MQPFIVIFSCSESVGQKYIVYLFIRSTFITLIQNKPVSNCIEHEYEQFIFFLTIFASCKIKQHCVAGLDVPHLHTNLTWFHPIVQRFQHFRLPPSLCTFLVYNVCTQQWPNYEARLWPVLKLNNMSWVKVHAKLYGKAKCFVWACIKVNNRRKYPDGLTLKPCQTSKTQPWWPHWSLI